MVIINVAAVHPVKINSHHLVAHRLKYSLSETNLLHGNKHFFEIVPSATASRTTPLHMAIQKSYNIAGRLTIKNRQQLKQLVEDFLFVEV